MKHITSAYFIGIGGVGMSGIARVAHDKGIRVSGSDIKESRYTKQLKEAGMTIHIGAHDKDNIPSGPDSPDVVVVTTAVLENNPELIAAKERNIEIWHRAQMLAALGQGVDTVAIAGTHGKTTTSSMVATILDSLRLDPSFLIGGIVRQYGSNAHYGAGNYYVVEADESDKSFRFLSPHAVLVTNIEADHLDHYKDLNEIEDKFRDFIDSVPSDGVLVVCGEDERLVSIAQSLDRPYLTYGFKEGCDVRITSWKPDGIASHFTVQFPEGESVESCIAQNPGRHNVLNGAGALALVYALGHSITDAAAALAQFRGVRRRFDYVGKEKGITVVDDYAHHPTEIAATIKAACALDYNKVHVLFQPHRYSRASLLCEVLHDEFSHAFDEASTVTFMDVFPAGEIPVPGISGNTFLNVVRDSDKHPEAYYVPRRIEVVDHMLKLANEGDLIITMGAGDVTALGNQIITKLLEDQS